MATRKLGDAPVPDGNLDAYRRLREGITSGRFQPSERLVEADLTRFLGAGRTAVRAALVRLDQEGLVTRELNRGARVRLVSDREALEIEEARSALERLLARQAAIKATPAQVRQLKQILAEMRRRLAAGDSVGYSELNPGFHQLIWASAQNATASRLVLNLKSQSLRFQFHTMLRPGRPQRSLHEHETIFNAIAAHEPDAAEAAMREHLEEVVENLRWAINHQERSPRWLSS
ncbi:MAG TPA: GntR family transcriptional regulator [Candidatus Limnocylindria bacterium]|nr:GntR family transcriptional regulator [Candidatus Limnocylindria bacterium]